MAVAEKPPPLPIQTLPQISVWNVNTWHILTNQLFKSSNIYNTIYNPAQYFYVFQCVNLVIIIILNILAPEIFNYYYVKLRKFNILLLDIVITLPYHSAEHWVLQVSSDYKKFCLV